MSIVPLVPTSSSSSPSTSQSSILSLDGLGTGIDWQSIVNEMQQADLAGLSPYNSQIQNDQNEISAWSNFSSQLSSLQTASSTLQSSTGMDLYAATVSSSSSTSASTLLSASASSSASAGSYKVVINNTAQAEQLASMSFSSNSAALNISGTILINGNAVQISSTDTLQNIEANINKLDTGTNASGVTASILKSSPTSYRLVLSSDYTGAAGISLLNASAADTLSTLGFSGTSTSIKNPISGGGAQSDPFPSSSTGVEALLGNENQDLAGTVTINGKSANIDLSQSLSTIATNLTNAGISASVATTVNGTQTTYQLQIAGPITSYTDQNNVLQTLGLIQGNGINESELQGSVANTTDGTTPITASTAIENIYGYGSSQYTTGDQITISGTTHSGTAVSPTNFAISPTTTVQDLLNEIQSLFGNVTASVTSNGQIKVTDNSTGTSQLSINLSASLGNSSATLNFGNFSGGQVLQNGTDASFSVDGLSMTSSSNTVSDAIQGVTLNLLGSDPNTTLTLQVNHDVQGMENEINSMISAYNGVMSFVNTQMSYNTQSNQTGGPLFGNTTLTGIKSQLASSVLAQVGTGTFQYLSQIGITAGNNGILSLNTSSFENAISTNFSSVAELFSDSAVTSDSQFQYVHSTGMTQSGTYQIQVTQLSGTNQDIAGQIDGQNATGLGNVLTLKNSQSGANGLSVSFTGTTVPATGNITVYRGVASMIDSLVTQFNDPSSGEITSEKNSLQSQITNLNTQVSNMQQSINSQIANLQAEFVNMNTTVAKLDSMQSYLTQQFASLAG